MVVKKLGKNWFVPLIYVAAFAAACLGIYKAVIYLADHHEEHVAIEAAAVRDRELIVELWARLDFEVQALEDVESELRVQRGELRRLEGLVGEALGVQGMTLGEACSLLWPEDASAVDVSADADLFGRCLEVYGPGPWVSR